MSSCPVYRTLAAALLLTAACGRNGASGDLSGYTSVSVVPLDGGAGVIATETDGAAASPPRAEGGAPAQGNADGGAADAASGSGAFGALCGAGAPACASGVCASYGRCTKPCRASSDCPTGPSWTCTSGACACVPSGLEACNGKDDDCDGITDNASDSQPLCADDNLCIAGACACPLLCASGPGSAAVCVDPNTDPVNCGACGNACASGSSCVGGICSPCSPGHPSSGCATCTSNGQCLTIVSADVGPSGTSYNNLLSIDGGYAYWTDTNGVERAPVTGTGPSTTLLSWDLSANPGVLPVAMTVAAGQIFTVWSSLPPALATPGSPSGGIVTYPMTGCGTGTQSCGSLLSQFQPTVSTTSNRISEANVTWDATAIYVQYPCDSIVVVPFDGSPTKTLPLSCPDPYSPDIPGIVSDGTSLFWIRVVGNQYYATGNQWVELPVIGGAPLVQDLVAYTDTLANYYGMQSTVGWSADAELVYVGEYGFVEKATGVGGGWDNQGRIASDGTLAFSPKDNGGLQRFTVADSSQVVDIDFPSVPNIPAACRENDSNTPYPYASTKPVRLDTNSVYWLWGTCIFEVGKD